MLGLLMMLVPVVLLAGFVLTWIVVGRLIVQILSRHDRESRPTWDFAIRCVAVLVLVLSVAAAMALGGYGLYRAALPILIP